MNNAINRDITLYTKEVIESMESAQLALYVQKCAETEGEYKPLEIELSSCKDAIAGVFDERIQFLQEQLSKRDEKLKVLDDFREYNSYIIKWGSPPLAYNQDNINKIEDYVKIRKRVNACVIYPLLRLASESDKVSESEFRLICNLAPRFTMQTNLGNSSLHLAIQSNCFSKMQIILECGQIEKKETGINQKNKEGNTPLHFAALAQIDGFVKCLFQHKVVPNLVNDKGESALKYAETFFEANNGQPGQGYHYLKGIMEAFEVVCISGGTQFDKIPDLHPLINKYLSYKV